MQRASSEIQREAVNGPVLLTFHDKPRFVMMSIEEYVRSHRGQVVAGPEAFPESVLARIRGLEDAYPDSIPHLAGGLAKLLDEEEPASGRRP